MGIQELNSGNLEINLRSFAKKIYRNRKLFSVSIASCMVIAIFYILTATPEYQASTSILIDSEGDNRQLGKSKYVEDGVTLIETEKNLFNEIGIIKSYSLIKQTVEDLHFDVQYYTNGLFKQQEHYGYFPFKVILNRDQNQIFGEPINVTLLGDDRYQITIEADDFVVFNPSAKSTREVNKELNFKKIYSFGETVQHDYFSFTLQKPDFELGEGEFEDENLSFVIYNSEDIASSYTENIDVNNIDIQASIFKLVSVGPLINKEVDFLGKLTENYIQNKFDSRNEIASTKAGFLQDQLNVVSDSLLKTELALESFKRSEGAVDLGSTASNALNQTQSLQVDRAKLQLDIRYYNSLINYIQKNRNADEFVTPSATGINDPLINQSLIELKSLYAERARKKFYVTSNNEEMNIINGQINEAISTLLGHLRSGIRSSRIALGSVSTQINNYSGVIDTLPSQQKDLLAIQRQSTLYENLFNYLSEELAKTGIARAESTSDTVILDEARMVGDGPVAPQKKLIMTLALVLGLLLPMAKIVFLSEDDEIETVGQIMSATEIPVIASIPRLKTGAKIPDSDLSHWKVKEAFRGLAANLKFASTEESCSILGITSNLPEEGKTFCSINLGIALAEAGKKTIIIDTDLRLPRIAKETGQVDGKGLSNYLSGEVNSVKEIIYPHQTLKNLQFIPTEVAEGNLHEMLSGPKMEALIAKLKEKFDYIIIDTPAVGLVSDFILFSDILDINLFVLRRSVGKKSFLQNFEKLITKGKKKKSFIVFNDAIDREDGYGYGKAYGSYKNPPIIKDSLSM